MSKTKKEKSFVPPTKVVIRRLPADLTKEEFLSVVSPLPPHNFIEFCAADRSNLAVRLSRVYINFDKFEDIPVFARQFDGYVFVDKRGNESQAIVEFAPFQKTSLRSRSPKRKDPRMNTIKDDPEYIEFLKKLENPVPVQLPGTEKMLEQIELEEKTLKENGLNGVKTPLVEFLEQKRLEAQARVEARGVYDYPGTYYDRHRRREEKRELRRLLKLEKRKQKMLRGKKDFTESYKESEYYDDDHDIGRFDEDMHMKKVEMVSKHKKLYDDPKAKLSRAERRRLARRDRGFVESNRSDLNKQDLSSLNNHKDHKQSTYTGKETKATFASSRKFDRKLTIDERVTKDARKQTESETIGNLVPQPAPSKRYSVLKKQKEEQKTVSQLQPSEAAPESEQEDMLLPKATEKVVEEDVVMDKNILSEKISEDSSCNAKQCSDLGVAADVSNSFHGNNVHEGMADDGNDDVRKASAEDDNRNETLSSQKLQANVYEEAESSFQGRSRNDPRTERKIRNKDRPAMQLYIPGQTRLVPKKHSDAGAVATVAKQTQSGSSGSGGERSGSSTPSPALPAEEAPPDCKDFAKGPRAGVRPSCLSRGKSYRRTDARRDNDDGYYGRRCDDSHDIGSRKYTGRCTQPELRKQGYSVAKRIAQDYEAELENRQNTDLRTEVACDDGHSKYTNRNTYSRTAQDSYNRNSKMRTRVYKNSNEAELDSYGVHDSYHYEGANDEQAGEPTQTDTTGGRKDGVGKRYSRIRAAEAGNRNNKSKLGCSTAAQEEAL